MPIKAKWRPFKDEVVELVPTKPGVYELGYGEIVVYIGSSDNSLQSRLRSHRKRKTFMKVTHFRFKELEWSTDARDLEKKLCEEFRQKNKGELPRLQERAPTKKSSIFDIKTPKIFGKW